MGQAGRSPRKRKTLEWPSVAAEIARRHEDGTKKCAELVAVSTNDEQACWRYLKRYGVERPPERRRRHYHWPEEALEIATRQGSAVSLCAELKRLTGYSERTCWAFLERHGIDRPGAKRRISFSETTFERLFDCVLNHGQKEASTRFKMDSKTIYNALYRRGLTSRAGDCFTLRDLQMFLRVRPSTILHWVELGLLKAKITMRSNGKPVYKFDHEEVVKFCREQMPRLLPRKWPERRLEFIELIACAPRHADQLATREAKKEHQAYEEQMSRDEERTEVKDSASRSNGQVRSGAARRQKDIESWPDGLDGARRVSTRAARNTKRGGRSRNSVPPVDDCA
jgi:hypothetical protein